MNTDIIRPMEAGDSDNLFAWRNQPEVRQHMFTRHEIGREEHERWFAAQMQRRDRHAWIIQWNGRGCGFARLAELDLEHRHTNWGMYVADAELRAAGIAALVEYEVIEHVFSTLQLHRIFCEVIADNAPALRLHDRFGFAREGVLRDHLFRDGRFVDVVRLGLLEEDWRKRRMKVQRAIENLAAWARVSIKSHNRFP